MLGDELVQGPHGCLMLSLQGRGGHGRDSKQ